MYLDGYRESWAGVRWERQLEERFNNPLYIEQYGYKVYSQNDEDGIINEIFNRVGTTNKKFVEFGIQDGLETNTHYLLFQGWKGLWIEGDAGYFQQTLENFRGPIDLGMLQVKNEFITVHNINAILSDAAIFGSIDLLSIDIDGNYYHILEAINIIRPRVIIVEYNAKFPPDCEWIMPYDENYIWNGTDQHGASLLSLSLLAEKKGYQLIGTNLSGVNAFFVKKDLVKNLFFEPASTQLLYNPARWDIKYMNGHPAQKCLIGNSLDNACESGDILKNGFTISQDKKDFLQISVKNLSADELYEKVEAAIIGDKNIELIQFDPTLLVHQAVAHLSFTYRQYINKVMWDSRKKTCSFYLKVSGFSEPVRGYEALQDSYTTQYYLEDCGGYDIYIDSKGKKMSERLRDVLSLAKIDSNMKVLDVGCGRGELSYTIANEIGADVWAIDYSEDAIALAKKTYQSIMPSTLKFYCMDIFSLSEKGFDRILMADVVEHIEKPKLEQLFAKMKTLLCKDGVMVIHTAPNKNYYDITYANKIQRLREEEVFLPKNPRSLYEHLMHINEQTPASLRETLNKSNWFSRVWTGSAPDLENQQSEEQQNGDNCIFALATQENVSLQKIVEQNLIRPNAQKVKVRFAAPGVSLRGSCGEKLCCAITVSNTGELTFDSQSVFKTNFCYHILKGDENSIIVFDGIRTALDAPLYSNETREIMLSVLVPDELPLGKYIVKATMVAEACFWFDSISEDYSVGIPLEVI